MYLVFIVPLPYQREKLTFEVHVTYTTVQTRWERQQWTFDWNAKDPNPHYKCSSYFSERLKELDILLPVFGQKVFRFRWIRSYVKTLRACNLCCNFPCKCPVSPPLYPQYTVADEGASQSQQEQDRLDKAAEKAKQKAEDARSQEEAKIAEAARKQQEAEEKERKRKEEDEKKRREVEEFKRHRLEMGPLLVILCSERLPWEKKDKEIGNMAKTLLQAEPRQLGSAEIEQMQMLLAERLPEAERIFASFEPTWRQRFYMIPLLDPSGVEEFSPTQRRGFTTAAWSPPQSHQNARVSPGHLSTLREQLRVLESKLKKLQAGLPKKCLVWPLNFKSVDSNEAASYSSPTYAMSPAIASAPAGTFMSAPAKLERQAPKVNYANQAPAALPPTRFVSKDVRVYFAYPEGQLTFPFCSELSQFFSAKELDTYPASLEPGRAICFFFATVNPRLGHNTLPKDSMLLNSLFAGNAVLVRLHYNGVNINTPDIDAAVQSSVGGRRFVVAASYTESWGNTGLSDSIKTTLVDPLKLRNDMIQAIQAVR